MITHLTIEACGPDEPTVLREMRELATKLESLGLGKPDRERLFPNGDAAPREMWQRGELRLTVDPSWYQASVENI